MVMRLFGSMNNYVKMLDKIGAFLVFLWVSKHVIFTVIQGPHFVPESSVEASVNTVLRLAVFAYLAGYFMVFRAVVKESLEPRPKKKIRKLKERWRRKA